MMRLAIENGHLVVRIQGAIDGFSADDISFVVDDWSLVNEFWRPKLPVSVSVHRNCRSPLRPPKN
jgi:hypothetical protein